MNRLKELREERGYSLEKVSTDLRIDNDTLSKYENGLETISQKDLYLFTKYFQANADYILLYDHDYLYAEIEGMNMVINFTHDEYVEFDKEKIYYIDNLRYVDINDISALLKFQDYVDNYSANIYSIDYKYLVLPSSEDPIIS